MKYKHYIEYIPKGTNPHTSSSIRNVCFCNDILNKDKVKSLATQQIIKQNIIDEYALRNHWELFDMNVKYNDPPWKNISELYSDILSIDGVKSVKKVDNNIYLYVYEDCAILDTYMELCCYYDGFSPSLKNDKIKIQYTPTYI